MTIGEKDVGYELRCGYPTAFDRDYTRDLGVGAVKTLEAGASSVLITRQEARIRPVPFAEIVDPKTGKARVRGVDVESRLVSQRAGAPGARLPPRISPIPKRLAAIAAAAKLAPEAAQAALRAVVSQAPAQAAPPAPRGGGGIPGGSRPSWGGCRRCRRRRCGCSA